MRVGVIGTGRIGVMHARHVAELEEVTELVLHDASPGSAEALADRLRADGAPVEVQVAPTLQEALQRCDGVVVATSTGAHPDVLRAAVAAGVPALCEKPIAADLATMQELVAHVEEHDALVVVGFQRRFDPAMAELHRRIRSGELGDLLVVRATGYDAVLPDPAYVPTSGGIFRDMMIHDLDAVPWLVGRPVVEVSAQGSVLLDPMFAEADDVDVATATLLFEGGVVAQLVATRFDPLGYDHRVEVLGTRDSLAVGLSHPSTPLAHLDADGRRTGTDPWPGFPERFAEAYRAEVRTFCDVVAGRQTNPSPVRESLVSLELAEACEQSRRTGSPVRPRSSAATH